MPARPVAARIQTQTRSEGFEVSPGQSAGETGNQVVVAGITAYTMPDTFALESEDIRKTFGHFTALAGVTLNVKCGEFLALFGRNGAGKTTFLKIAATLVRHTHGNLRIEGLDIREEPEKIRRHIGFLSHNTYLYRDLTPIEN